MNRKQDFEMMIDDLNLLEWQIEELHDVLLLFSLVLFAVGMIIGAVIGKII